MMASVNRQCDRPKPSQSNEKRMRRVIKSWVMALIFYFTQQLWFDQNRPVVLLCIHVLLPLWQEMGGWKNTRGVCVYRLGYVRLCWVLVNTMWASLTTSVPIQGTDSYIKNTICTLPGSINLLPVGTVLCVSVCMYVCNRLDSAWF